MRINNPNNKILGNIGLELGTTQLTCQESTHFIFIYEYNFVLMVNIHNRNTQINYRMKHNYAGIHIIIEYNA